MRHRPLIVALSAAAFLAATPRAMSADKAPPVEEPLSMSADRLDLDVEAKTAVLTGHVTLARGAMSLSCPRVDVRYDQVPHVTWARGSGGVVAEVKGVRAEAPDVELDLAARTMELRGGVRLTRGEGWITADRASINIATAKVTMSDVKGSIPIPKPSP
jgi:lipopolysaccharide export system protein LptA